MSLVEKIEAKVAELAGLFIVLVVIIPMSILFLLATAHLIVWQIQRFGDTMHLTSSFFR